MREAVVRTALAGRARSVAATITMQWRPVVLPGLVLWVIAMFVAGAILNSFDVQEYARYAHAALHAPLLHHYPNEYPAPALAVFSLPLLLPFPYPWAFAIPVGVMLILLLMSFDATGVPGLDQAGARRLIVYLALGEVMVLTSRYDLFAVAATFWAYRAAKQHRWSAAWTWCSVGVALKLFPVILWPVLLIAEWRETGRPPLRRGLWMAASVVALVALPLAFDRAALGNVVRYYLHRPPEIGGLASGLALLADWHGWGFVVSFHSVNALGPVAAPLSIVFETLAVAGCVWVWRMQFRGRLDIEAACLASASFLVLGSKVLSIQYVMWLMPFWALYRLRTTWLLACIANSVIFPYTISASVFGFVPNHTLVISLTLTYLARDLLIVAGTAAWLRDALDDRAVTRARALGPVLDST